MLFNNLNTIYAYALEQPDKTPSLILMLSNNLKHVLYESNAEKITLNKEIVFIDNYMTFQTIRTEVVLKVNYTKNILNENYKIAPLLLITIIENSFKHCPLNGEVSVCISVNNGCLECLCENNFKTHATENANLKIGLKNLEKRLQLIYKSNYELKITKDKLFRVALKLKLK